MNKSTGNSHNCFRALKRGPALILVVAMVLVSMNVLLPSRAAGAVIPPLDTPNQATWVTDGDVYAAASDGDTTYIGGYFNHVLPYTGCGAPISEAACELQPTFPRVNRRVSAAAPDGSGGWYIGGDFTEVGGVERKKIAHILPDGTLDAGWDPGVTGGVEDIAVSGGTVYAGGNFTQIGGQPRSNIAALDATGSATSWNPDSNGPVSALAIIGGTVYAGGNFTSMGGQPRGYLAAMDASGNVTGWNPDADSRVYALTVSASAVGIIYVGGSFSSVGGELRSRIAEIDVGGSATSWNPGSDGNVYALAARPGFVYAGGNFTQMGGQPRNNIAEIDMGGSATSWDPGADEYVLALAVSGGTVYAGGVFTQMGGQHRNYIAAIDATGVVTPWDPHANSYVLALAAGSGTVYAGGYFSGICGEMRRNIAALDATGTATSWAPHADDAVHAIAASGGIVYVGGLFTAIGGRYQCSIAAIDASGTATSWGHDADGSVEALAVQGGTVYAGGQFTDIGGEKRDYIAALDVGTGDATAWDPVSDGPVYDLAIGGGTVYAGGIFTQMGGQPRSNIAAIDATGSATSWDPDSDGPVYALALPYTVTGGTLYIGGSFTQIGGQPRNNIAAIDANGNATSWDPDANTVVFALAVDGYTFYAGGDFSSIGGEARSRVAALDATGSATSWNPYMNSRVKAIAVGGGTVSVGGYYAIVGSEYRHHLTQFKPPAPTITEISPPAGTVGTEVTLTGLYFGGTMGSSRVSFGSTHATDYISWGDNKIKCKVPSGISGKVGVTVTTVWGASNIRQFSVIPEITTMNPKTGSVGTEVVLTGSAFGGVRGASYVSFGSTHVADYISWGDNKMRCRVPPIGSGDYEVRVTTPGGESNTRAFTVTSAIPSITWYLAEGYTGDGNYPGEAFDTYVLVQNPAGEDARVRATYMLPGGDTIQEEYTVLPYERFTVHLDDIEGLHNTSVSTHLEVTNGVKVICERAMYFNYYGKQGGHDSIGVNSPETTWYLAEGYTGDGNYPGEAFDTYVLVQNPAGEDARVRATYMLPGGSTIQEEYTVLPYERFTVHLDDIEGLHNTSVSTYLEVTNGVPVICERAMYFNYYGKQGGHDSIGVNSPDTTWYLAEGYTGDGNYPGEAFDTYVLVQNPAGEDARVRATYMLPGGSTIQEEYTVLPYERFTVHLDDIEGLHNTSVSTYLEVTNGVPVICERAMYFNYYGKQGGHDSIGVNSPDTTWYLAEGYTGDGNYPGEAFDTYVLVQNPSDRDTRVNVSFMFPDRGVINKAYDLKAFERFTVHVDEIPGCVNTSVSTGIQSLDGAGIICERAMYFNYYGTIGGHGSLGYTD